MSDEPCLRLTTYFGERERAGGRLLADALIDLYGREGVQTSVLLRGAEGFARLHHLRTDRLLSLSEDAPVVSIVVDRAARIEALLEPVRQLTRKGLITLERVRRLTPESAATGPQDEPGDASQLTVFLGRGERSRRGPAHVAVCDLLFRHGIAGASVLLGVDGIARGRRQRASFFAGNAEVPVMILAVGAAQRIAAVLPKLADLLHDPVLTVEPVRVCKRDGEALAAPHALSSPGEPDLATWRKLTVYSSQDATHEGRPLNLEIICRLRESQAAGATSLRGIWGFHDDRPPHGDRLLQVRRHVPVLTMTLDSPENAASSYAIIDELTTEHGLVTSAAVPAMTALSAARTVGGLTIGTP